MTIVHLTIYEPPKTMKVLSFGFTASHLVRFRNRTIKRPICTGHNTVHMSENSKRPSVLICDVLDTLVADPFSRGMHNHFGFSNMKQFLDAKTPHAWIKFELGEYDESTLAAEFFKDKRYVDIEALKKFLSHTYRLLPGIDELLTDLRTRQVPVHICSNYGPWYTIIEQALGLHRNYGVHWTFVSSEQHARKPDINAYELAAKLAQAHPSQCVLLDDRARNCDGALIAGYRGAITFESVKQTRGELAPFFGDWLVDPTLR